MLRARMFRSLIIRTGIKERNIRARNIQHVLFPTINNNCKLYTVLQLIIIVNFRASLRTKQYYWMKKLLGE